MSLLDDHLQPDPLGLLRGLVDLLSDPKATKARIAELEGATTKHNEAAAAAQKAKRELRNAQEAAAAEMERKEVEHRKTLSDERLALNAEINRRKNEVAKAEEAVRAAKAAAENDARQAVELRTRWQKKIDAIDAGLRA
jgi:flagellar motility protein MotE (MotC chaperone)